MNNRSLEKADNIYDSGVCSHHRLVSDKQMKMGGESQDRSIRIRPERMAEFARLSLFVESDSD